MLYKMCNFKPAKKRGQMGKAEVFFIFLKKDDIYSIPNRWIYLGTDKVLLAA